MAIINDTIAKSLEIYDKTAPEAMYELVSTNKQSKANELLSALAFSEPLELVEVESNYSSRTIDLKDVPIISNADYVKTFKQKK
jgi:hypothetical protein